ncbi:cytochrome c oxidase subunit 3 [Haladaptatus caseinilyticus]|uniref:cytochrome c oxidase subunit 3 n=1 Tax=Haladaptatus caseinilyticus TaxID=2993314 RepID=UPI00224B4635|nr:heme-copper oxidase subunit III [Haladaptatus caseinilyticus]
MSGGNVGEEHEPHHHPAPEDWPRGFGEASWWPFVSAFGVAGLYVGAGLYVLSHGGNDYVSPLSSAAVFVAGTVVFLIGLYGWLYHGFVDRYWSYEGAGGTKLRWAMVLFLITEVATFGAGFVYYFFIRAGTWPPTGQTIPPLVNSLVLINTLILVTSSVTLHFSHVALHRGKRRQFVGLLTLTVVLSIVFIGGQAFEYYEYITHEGFTLTSGVFGSAFFGLTGLHGLHVSLGIVLMTILLGRALIGQYNADRDTSISTVSMYWHFVDAVWIFLVVSIYAGASLSG